MAGRPSKKAPKVVATRVCGKCGLRKPITEFYSHHLWQENGGTDYWCKQCVREYVVDKETLRDYCYNNNRSLTDEHYQWLVDKETEQLAYDPEIESCYTNADRDALLEKRIIRKFFSTMNLKMCYGYVRNIAPAIITSQKHKDELPEAIEVSGAKDGVLTVDEFGDPVEETDTAPNLTDQIHLEHSEKWGGFFSKADIAAMDAQLANMEKQFFLETDVDLGDAMDYVRQGIVVRDLYRAMQNGDSGAAEKYIKITKNRRELAKEAEFTKKSRSKQQETAADDSIGTRVASLEENGFILEPVIFPDDQLDVLRKEIMFLRTSLGVTDDELTNTGD